MSDDNSVPEPSEEETKENPDENVNENASGEVTPCHSDLDFEIDPEVLERLTTGFLSHCLPDLQKAKGVLTEILQSQTVLQENIHNENNKLKISEDVEKTMAKVKLYHTKLLHLKREMNSLADKSFKLKKRGVKLHQMKQKEEAQKQEQEEKDKIREEMLTAKVAKQRTSSRTDS